MSQGLTAGQKVSATFELLEQILLVASMQDVLVAQRVARSWKETIETSHKLQVGLFTQDFANTSQYRAEKQATANQTSLRIVQLTNDAPESDCGPPHINPYLTHIFTPVSYNEEDSFKFKPSAKRFTTDGAWKKMYISLPPMTRVVVESTDQTIGHSVAAKLGQEGKVYGWGMLLEKTSGLMIGDLYEPLSKINSLCDAMAQEHPEQASQYARRGDYYEDEDEDEDEDEGSEYDEDTNDEHIFYFNLLTPPPS